MTKKTKWEIEGKELSAHDLAKMEELLRAATPGPRGWAHNNSLHVTGSWEYIIEHGEGFDYSEYTHQSGENDVSEADKAFIAACDPATILALVNLARKSLQPQT